MTQDEAAQRLRELQQAGANDAEIEAATAAYGSLQSDAERVNDSVHAIYEIMIEQPTLRLFARVKSVFRP